MPTFDGGHYFFTGLFPVKLKAECRPNGSWTAPSHILREALATLPNASEYGRPDVRRSPFARCRSTHFARLAVIDDTAFNGRETADAILQAVQGVDLLAHDPVDHLRQPWLIFVVDFDSPDGSDASRDEWARGLWDVMEPELRAVFANCCEFDSVTDGASFARYLARGQIETHLPFNDYWIDPPTIPALGVGRMLAQAGIVLALVLGGAWLIDREWGGGWMLWTAAVLIGIALALYAVYRLILSRGERSWPAAPNSDLKSILKSVYVQQHFTRFAIAQQGASPEALHEAFGRFLAETQPANLEAPTQAAGAVRS
ncbi:AtpZ/AtpI family protein [Allosphingosinicella sp.]|jgi:hypothetical protein|uniref:AtpZ/AtpI family protein n=1 Tax=Allosphingosinicella sp. TaxID=2823234 RepID=UPI002F203756